VSANISSEEAATLAASLDPEAQARAAVAEQHGTATACAIPGLRESCRRALLQLDCALAEVQRIVGEITGGAQ